jgi:hypothetical protein
LFLTSRHTQKRSLEIEFQDDKVIPVTSTQLFCICGIKSDGIYFEILNTIFNQEDRWTGHVARMGESRGA